MNRISHLLFLIFLILINIAYAQAQPVNSRCGNGKINFQGHEIALGPHAFYIDGKLTDEEAARQPYVFNSINEAAKHLTDGTEKEPMTLYIAPWVYWIDNPDDPGIREPKQPNGTPFGLEIKCNWLKFVGLTYDPKEVILASNRGQTMGAKGNFTMLCITGDGTSAENITMGNYCNIDLVYPPNPSLNRPKRGTAIVQAQLAFCFGDKILARNCRFVSRLNLCPMTGGKRTLFDRCHFECTDDALAPTAVYLNCDFDFYSSKPFWGTEGTGAVLLNCDIHSLTRGEQYLVKTRGPVAAIDCRWTGENCSYIGWKEKPSADTRNYVYHQTFNNLDYQIGTHHPANTVELAEKRLQDAYRFEYDGQTLYNTYNLLRGNDDWDPMQIKDKVLKKEQISGKNFSNISTQLIIKPSTDSIETSRDKALLKVTAKRFGNYDFDPVAVQWACNADSFVILKPLADGNCEILPNNSTDFARKVIITATSADGLEAATELTVLPRILEVPAFKKQPQLRFQKDRKVVLAYALDSKYADQSIIRWFRCNDAKGTDAIVVATSRFGKPTNTYTLQPGDMGCYLMAEISPKHIRSKVGKPIRIVSKMPNKIDPQHSIDRHIEPDLSTLSTAYQPIIRAGYWTMDSYAPADTYDWKADNSHDPWYYGRGEDGAAQDTGLVMATKGARLRYTPVETQMGDMKISFTAIPGKTAGQGFSSARQQYMDVFIKFDTEKLTGYALRLIRTTKYGDAIDFMFMQYENGIAKPISEPVTSDCFRPDCSISLEVKGNILKATAINKKPYYIIPNRPDVKQNVEMSIPITPNNFGGFGIQHTGTVGGGATLIKDLKVDWE